MAANGTAEIANGIKHELAPSITAQLASILVLLEKAVSVKDTKLLLGRLLRQTAAIRKHLSRDLLKNFVQDALPANNSSSPFLLEELSKASRKVASSRKFCTFS